MEMKMVNMMVNQGHQTRKMMQLTRKTTSKKTQKNRKTKTKAKTKTKTIPKSSSQLTPENSATSLLEEEKTLE